MIEVRSFSGDGAELAALTESTWTSLYDGEMLYPVWSADYFEWQLLARQEPDRDFLVAAYDSGKLIGCFLAEPLPFQLHGESVQGTMGGWLTVSPEIGGPGVGLRLVEEQRRRHRDRGKEFLVGYGYFGAKSSGGPLFWSRVRDAELAGKLGFCVRILDIDAVREWCFERWERWGLTAWRMFHSTPHQSSNCLVPYSVAHLDDCLGLVNQVGSGTQLAYDWSPDRLQHQLAGSHLARSFVSVDEGAATGLVNYYLLEMRGRTSIKVAVIDLLVLPARRVRTFLETALAQMQSDGAQMAMVLRQRKTPVATLLRRGFLPLPSDTWLVTAFLSRSLNLRRTRDVHITWR